MFKLLIKAVKHPVRAILHLPSWLDRELRFSEYSKACNKGERLVIKDWQSARNSSDASTLAHIQRYEWVLPLVKNDRMLLDDGCGSGYGAYYLATQVVGKVVGVDLSKDAIRFAGRHYWAENLVFMIMDACELTFSSRTFDAVVSFDVLEHIPFELKGKFISETIRILKPGGILYIGCPNGPAPGIYNPFHYDLSKEEFSKLLSRHFRDISFLGQALEINGVRQERDWYNHLPAKLSPEDLVIAKWDSGPMFGLLAIARK